ncbi:MAG: cysteine desulfurase [Muribaculaceae bacterium]|nr:cysteine desulfurase [Muribaculaceae bacterium]
MKEIYDVEALRADFPILAETVYGKPLVYLDNTATSQTPRQVVEEIDRLYTHTKANVHRGVHCLSQKATAAMEASRERVRAFIGADSTDEIIFTRGTTESLNLVAASYGSLLDEGDEIILTVMEHHSNIVPWQLLAARKGVVIKVVPCDDRGVLDIDAYRALFTDRTRLVSFCHVSNVLGTVNPVAEMAAYAHEHGAVVCIDGAQAIAHEKIDVKALGADFYAFSSHKMYGPTGIGILYGRRDLLDAMPPYQGGGEMIGHVSFSGTTWADLPYKFEAGTPDFIGAAALAKAIDYMENVGIERIAAHEAKLLERATAAIADIPGLRIFGTAPGKAAVLSFLVGDAHHYDTGVLLDQMGIEVRTGHHCAQPLMERFGIEGTVRASFALYNTEAEVDAFAAALRRAAAMLA